MTTQAASRRRLHGRRGLKSDTHCNVTLTAQSPPSRAAWIEIWLPPFSARTGRQSPPSRAAWIEIRPRPTISAGGQSSPPSRAAWIEISTTAIGCEVQHRRRLHGRRGLKYKAFYFPRRKVASPPSRAAWIEIRLLHRFLRNRKVAAFTGGVD